MTTLIFPKNHRQCASFSINMAFLFLSFMRATAAPNKFDRQSALQTPQKENTDHIPFTLTFHPHNHAVKSPILENFKLLQNDSETWTIFSQPPLLSLKRDISILRLLSSYVFYLFLSLKRATSAPKKFTDSQYNKRHRRKNSFIILFTLTFTLKKNPRSSSEGKMTRYFQMRKIKKLPFHS